MDLPNLTNTAFMLRTANFTPSSSGTYNFGFQCYSIANQYNLYFDDVTVELAPVIPPSCATGLVPANNATEQNWLGLNMTWLLLPNATRI